MKRLRKSLLLLSLLTFTNFSFGQLNQSQVEAIFQEIDIKSFQTVKVITNKFDDNSNSSTFKFDSEMTKIFYNEGYMTIKDDSGMVVFIPYVNITLVKTAPKSGTEIANVSIYVID